MIKKVAVPAMLTLIAAASGQAFADPANKTQATGSTYKEIGPTNKYKPVVLLKTTVKTSDKADLLIEFNSECGIGIKDFDYISNRYSDLDYYAAKAEVWVEIDGKPVPVNPNAKYPDNGQVTFCGLKEFEFKSIYSYYYAKSFEYLYSKTKQANSFRWFAEDVGHGPHEVVVKAKLKEYGKSYDGKIKAAIGNRTLVVEPLNNLNKPDK